jgi:hypothetical protein
MLRRDSTSKWKQLLGFDDGCSQLIAAIAPPTPLYSDDDLASEISLPLPPAQSRYPLGFALPADLYLRGPYSPPGGEIGCAVL